MRENADGTIKLKRRADGTAGEEGGRVSVKRADKYSF